LPKHNPLETISFDFGGTLVYHEKEGHIVYYEILKELGFDVELDYLKKAHENARNWWTKEKQRTQKIWTEDVWHYSVQRMLSNLTLPSSRELASKICGLWPRRVALKTYEDVKSTLEKLKQRKFKLIIVSNVSSNRNLQSYLTRVELESYFDTLVGSGSVGYEKPNPEIFKLASKLSNTPFTRMMHVGDSYREDYLGAVSIGIKAVLLDRKGVHSDKQCQKISRLSELLNLLCEV
jgi:putative hydrolase of the HAD superfamily